MIPGLPGEQVDVLTLLARGLDHPQIAVQLGVSVRDSRLLLQESLTTLKATNPLHGVALAIGLGILPADVATNT